MNIPTQCQNCLHLFYDHSQGRCKKRLMQHCERDDALQKLVMKPGHCALLNPENDCGQYTPGGGWKRVRIVVVALLILVLFYLMTLGVNNCLP